MVQGIILAAGLSTRMGRPKLVLEVGGRPVIQTVAEAALGSGLNRIVLVVGPSATDLRSHLGSLAGDPKLGIVENPRPEHGMSSSLRAGMKAVDDGTAGVMIILADQPGQTSQLFDRLAAEFVKHPQSIVAPAINGRRTNPVIFPGWLFEELIKQSGDIGGREVLNRHADRVVLVEMGSEYDDRDLDTPEDLQRMNGNSRCRSNG